MATGRKRWCLALGLAVVLGGGLVAWRWHAVRTQERRIFQGAADLIAQGQGEAALEIIHRNSGPDRRLNETSRKAWHGLQIAALARAGHISELLVEYERSVAFFHEQEATALVLARALLQAGNLTAFETLRTGWKQRETLAAAWLELDVDERLARGKPEEALQLLNAWSFEGPADCGRLVRLASLNILVDPKVAGELLTRAAKLDPRHPEVHLTRAQLLENSGQLGPAHAEFRAVLAAHPNHAFYRDQLAGFYQRTGNFDQAVQTWAAGLTNRQATDWLWLHAAFWERLTRPMKFDWTHPAPFGSLQPFVRYLTVLPAGKFWDEAAFDKLAEARRFEQQLQEVFWLRLLHALQTGNENEAVKQLEFNRARAKSWHRELESAMLRVLMYRRTGEVKFPVGVNLALSEAPPRSRHQLFEQLDVLTKNPTQPPAPELERLLRGTNAFAAVLLAAGWAEAALNLPQDETLPEGLPEWLAYGFTQAIRFNRSPAAAREFAARQKSSPALELLGAELLLGEDQTEAALLKLSPLATTDSETGARAAQLAAETQLRLKQFTAARVTVETSPRFRKSVAGQELLARLALAEDKPTEAESIYAAIENESDEARFFLARQAFNQKNWLRARRLTEELAKKYPDRPQLRINLEAITRAESEK